MYLIEVHNFVKAARYRNTTSQLDSLFGMPELVETEAVDNPLLRLNLRFSSFTVIEVWRVGASVREQHWEPSVMNLLCKNNAPSIESVNGLCMCSLLVHFETLPFLRLSRRCP